MKLTRGKKITLWIVGIILFIILGLGVGTYIYANSLLNKMEKVEIDKEDFGITEDIKEKLTQ